MIEMADLMQHGIPPVAGGALDQAAAFLDACRLIWSDQAEHKAEAMKEALRGR